MTTKPKPATAHPIDPDRVLAPEHYGINTQIRVTVSRDLSCELSAEERDDKARQIAAKLREIDRENDRQAEVKAGLKAAAAKLTGELAKLRAQESTGFETRPVPCHEVRDFRVGMVRFVRLDTGDDDEVRPMHAFERQAVLPGVEGRDQAPDDDDDDDDDGNPAPKAAPRRPVRLEG